jgi:hypothetical protein
LHPLTRKYDIQKYMIELDFEKKAQSLHFMHIQYINDGQKKWNLLILRNKTVRFYKFIKLK